jgi:hypothetical protein
MCWAPYVFGPLCAEPPSAELLCAEPLCTDPLSTARLCVEPLMR